MAMLIYAELFHIYNGYNMTQEVIAKTRLYNNKQGESLVLVNSY